MFPVATFFLRRTASEDIIFYIKLLEVAEFMCDVWVHHALLSLPDPYLMRPISAPWVEIMAILYSTHQTLAGLQAPKYLFS